MRVTRLISTICLAIALLAEDVTAKAKALMKEKKFDEAIKLLEEDFAKSKSAAVKTVLADAHVANGNSLMYNEALPPMRKYPAALREFRAALKYDGENKKAKANIDTIESIYKSMGRPVPQ